MPILNDGKKQILYSDTKANNYSQAVLPASFVTAKRASYVNINRAGTFKFMYESGSEATSFITGSVVTANHGNIRLDINPIAWQRTDDASVTGDVTFVYVRVR
jgi:hypothetical protein